MTGTINRVKLNKVNNVMNVDVVMMTPIGLIMQ